jgi:transcriptional regulator GlxA family with amidase domain
MAGTHQILNQVNTFLEAAGRKPVFQVQFVGLSMQSGPISPGFTATPDVLIKDVKKTDLIIIPAIHNAPQEVLEHNAPFISWVKEQYENGAEVASLCIGAFMLASTGLLNGKQCATHWASANDFRAMFPEVNLVDDKIMTEEDRLYTSGGAYSYLNLLLYLIEKHAGRDIAIRISKTFMIDIDRKSQSPFIMFQGQKEHDDEQVKKAQEFIESNFQEKITVDQLSDMFAIGRRSFERRFKKATANSVVEYIQRVKIEAAKQSLESSRENVNEVMYSVGYADPKAFRLTFKKITGLSPIEYRNKYNRSIPAA